MWKWYEMSVRDSRSSRLHAGQRRGGRGLHDGPTTTPSASTSKSSSFHSPGEREVEARLRTRDDMANSGFASSQPLSCDFPDQPGDDVALGFFRCLENRELICR